MSAKFKRGDKVKLTQSWAEWQLEHPECWQHPRTGAIDDFADFEATMQLAMLALLDAPVVGTVISEAGRVTAAKVKFPRYKVERVDEADIYPANQVELTLEIAGKARKKLEKLSKLSGVPIDQIVAVLMAREVLNANLE